VGKVKRESKRWGNGEEDRDWKWVNGGENSGERVVLRI
jgi:hypothetical protein